MHSFTAFPLFRTSRNDETMEKGKFAKKPQTGGFNPGLEVFNHKDKNLRGNGSLFHTFNQFHSFIININF